MEKKKKIIIISGIVVALLLIIIACILIFKDDSHTLPNVEKKQTLEDILTETGKDYYENSYYEGNADIVSLFKDSGISLDITSLTVINPLSEEAKKEFDDRKCSYDDSQIIFYPVDPFKKTDYEIKVELVCEK